VRRVAARYAVAAMSARGEAVTTWVIDDTGFLKQGTCSVGVQRQYTGSAGKIANCQVGVSLSVATRTEHLPIDFALYVPSSWADDPARRAAAKIPEEMRFQTKIELALGMIETALGDGLPGETVLADSAYGESNLFRETVRLHGLDYAVGVHSADQGLVSRQERATPGRGRQRTGAWRRSRTQGISARNVARGNRKEAVVALLLPASPGELAAALSLLPSSQSRPPSSKLGGSLAFRREFPAVVVGSSVGR
jgi:SRSO17 transposase